MEIQAISRNVRMSAQKMREVVRQIQGMNAVQAQAVLAVVPRKSARFVAGGTPALLFHLSDKTILMWQLRFRIGPAEPRAFGMTRRSVVAV